MAYQKFLGLYKRFRIVACPGCYPTAVLLSILLLIKENIISSEDIIILSLVFQKVRE